MSADEAASLQIANQRGSMVKVNPSVIQEDISCRTSETCSEAGSSCASEKTGGLASNPLRSRHVDTPSHCMVTPNNDLKAGHPHSNSYTNIRHPLTSETPMRKNDGLLSRLKELEKNLTNVDSVPSYGWHKPSPPQYHRHPRTSGIHNFEDETTLSQVSSARQKQQRRLRLDQFVQSAKRNAAKRSKSRNILLQDRDHPYSSWRRTQNDL